MTDSQANGDPAGGAGANRLGALGVSLGGWLFQHLAGTAVDPDSQEDLNLVAVLGTAAQGLASNLR